MAITALRPQPRKKVFTYEEYLRTPETNERYEIVEGEWIMSPAPTTKHQWLLTEINDVLKPFVRQNELGVVLFASLDIVIRKIPRLQTRQPDMLFFTAERIGGITLADLDRALDMGLGPDMVLEILSPNERKRRLRGKLVDYAGLDVTEVWVLSIETRTLEILTLSNGAYRTTAQFGEEDEVTSAVIPGLRFRLGPVFE